MENKLTILALAAAVITDVTLEIMGIKVPTIVILLSGFAARHIMGDNSKPEVKV